MLGTMALLVPLAFAAHARAATRRRPDLVISSLSASGSLTVGSSVTAMVTTRNIGQRRAGASTTRLYLSRDRTWSTDDKILASASIPALDPGKAVTRELKARVPTTTPSAGELVACADAGHKVTEKSETNNCRAKPDTDSDGWADFTDCAPNDPSVNPGAVDEPDVPKFRDTNCDGIDGNARHAVFVSPIGDDASSGTRAHPKRTLAAAVSAADTQGKDVYSTFGIYTERLDVANGVGVYGGYGTTWKRPLSNITKVTGTTSSSAVANNVTSPTTLQLLSLAPVAPDGPGKSSCGLRGANSGGLLIDHVTVHAAPGTDGLAGAKGTQGTSGGDGHPGNDPQTPQLGGTSAVGHTGGRGGNGGYYEGDLDAPLTANTAETA
ncbi:MAG TPA: CARDB domain-containing protein [Rubrobacter sp.]